MEDAAVLRSDTGTAARNARARARTRGRHPERSLRLPGLRGLWRGDPAPAGGRPRLRARSVRRAPGVASALAAGRLRRRAEPVAADVDGALRPVLRPPDGARRAGAAAGRGVAAHPAATAAGGQRAGAASGRSSGPGIVSMISIAFVYSIGSSSIIARGLNAGSLITPWTRRRCMPKLPAS